MTTAKLIGKWFHSFDSEGEIKWQGRILAKPDGMYLVQLYDWMIAPRDMAGWRFYDTAEEMREAWEKYKSDRGLNAWGGRARDHESQGREWLTSSK